MDSSVAFPQSPKKALFNIMMVREMDRELMPWKESFRTDRILAMIMEDNNMERQPVDASVPQGSPVSMIHFEIENSVLIKWIKEYVSAVVEQFFVHDLGWLTTETDFNCVATILEKCTEKST
jgi:hypothetical protein